MMGATNNGMSAKVIRGVLLAMALFLGLALIQAGGRGNSAPPRGDTFGAGRRVEYAEYIVYLPAGSKANIPRPLVILLSPTGEPDTLIRTWQAVAEKYKWTLLASRRFRNGISWAEETSVYRTIDAAVREGKLPCAVDPKRIIASGISGGGWGAHDFAFLYPGLISGVVINTGMMNAEFLCPQRDRYPGGEFAVFLASPTDSRYREMTGDRRFLEEMGWKIEWIEFPGGHVFAPPEAYFRAARWAADIWGQSSRSRDKKALYVKELLTTQGGWPVAAR